MTPRLNEKVAIVTGGGSGYGAGIATKFVAEGAKVIIADLSSEDGEKTAQELGCIFVKAGVTSRNDWESILRIALANSAVLTSWSITLARAPRIRYVRGSMYGRVLSSIQSDAIVKLPRGTGLRMSISQPLRFSMPTST